jgi:hypothetical protein
MQFSQNTGVAWHGAAQASASGRELDFLSEMFLLSIILNCKRHFLGQKAGNLAILSSSLPISNAVKMKVKNPIS